MSFSWTRNQPVFQPFKELSLFFFLRKGNSLKLFMDNGFLCLDVEVKTRDNLLLFIGGKLEIIFYFHLCNAIGSFSIGGRTDTIENIRAAVLIIERIRKGR